MSMFDRIRPKLRSRRAIPPLACNELVEIITEHLEGTLSPRDRARFEAHLDECEGCRNYLEQMRRTIQVVGRIRDESIPPQAREALLQAFRAWKQD